MLFIFVQSAMPGHLSGAESSFIAHFIAGITGWNEEILSIVVRKAAHFTEFLILGICLSVNMRDMASANAEAGRLKNGLRSDLELDQKGNAGSAGKAGGRRPAVSGAYWFAAWFIGTVYAMTDEFHQLFVQGRVCSATDMCIDSAGVACGVLIYCAFMKRASKRARKTRS